MDQRVELAQALWESIEEGLDGSDDVVGIAEASARDDALTAGDVSGRSHEEVMEAVRRVLG
jgi:hypothetical protein